MKCLARILCYIAFISCFWSQCYGQENETNKYGLLVINDAARYQNSILLSTDKEMADIRTCLPAVILDLKYSSSENFTHKKLYPKLHTTYLRKKTMEALKNVLNELSNRNLGVKIFDAYRPYSVTEAMWAIVPDDRYAADPAMGSGHNRGVAVDLTLVDLTTNLELPMGTTFDNFSDTAHTSFNKLSKLILENRNTLISAMEKNGFISLETEWWHFSLPDAANFELLDLDFKTLKCLASICTP